MEKIIINAADPEECRVAMLDGEGRLQEYYTESNTKLMSLSNIYKGIIQNIEPSLQAVFVNYGNDRNGFLQLCDIHPEYYLDQEATIHNADVRRCLRKGQQLLVQVLKEPTTIKGAALTTYISLAGRFVVLTPGREHVGVSRKIENDRERARLRAISDDLPVPPGLGYIVRTVAEDRTAKELAEDLYQVHSLWEDIRRRGQEASAPSLIYREQDLAIKILRDHYTTEVKEILVDDLPTYQKVVEYIKNIAPNQHKIVRFHKEKRPIFARHQLEEQLATIYQNSVKLKGGGSIVITPTEALVAIDVNSGKGTKEVNLEDTAFQTNLEAADEVARQLRLRDLGGLVVVDFIDMRDDHHRREIERRIREASKMDKAKRDFGYISKFGLLEMTRQKLRPSIETGSYVVCPHCQGRGQIKTSESCSLALIRQITHMVSKGGLGEVRARLYPDAAHYLLNYKRHDLAALEERYGTKIMVSGDPSIPPGQFEVESSRKVHEAEVLKPGRVSGLYDDEDASLDSLDYAAHNGHARPDPLSDDDNGPRHQFDRGQGERHPSDRNQTDRHPSDHHPTRHGPKSGDSKKDNPRGRRPFNKGRGRQNGPKDPEATRDGAFV
ncbi:MAG: Rne/Rng family ribonuclease [Deltaproteobacteria bacterium]|nr:Rne/Rng family ribonuclease [Deltaproteobacteria bacterium]